MRSAAGDRSNELLLYLIYFYISLRTRSHIFGNRSEERGARSEGTRGTRERREPRELRKLRGQGRPGGQGREES
ncbi:hypothetical protein [Chroococcidiopsis thermalis]|uniref:hypothetical protein n=1 Tax=Chroococcidiopsis thermalis TaxID=54299 RepID=UPI0003080050|nr:hypothetical protein [Chroococcidiopsis thermalis]